MKISKLLIAPLMAIPFLTSFGCSAKTYHVKFTNGNGTVKEEDYKWNEVIVAPEDPAPYEKDHKTYTFDAWYDGENKFKSGVTRATKNVEYVAQFNSEDIKYTVAFKYADGQTESVKKTISIDKLTIIAPETKMISTLGRAAWKTSDGLIIDSNESRTFDKSELNDYVFNETDVDCYSITYILGNEAAVNPGTNPKSYKTTDTVTLAEPTLDGFTFKGWYLSNNEHNKFQYQTGWSAEEMTGNLILYADWHITDKTLNDYSWQEISDISDSDEASKYFDIADTKNLNVDGNDNQVRILDFNHDRLSTSSNNEMKYAWITFEFVNTISGFTTHWNDKDGTNSDAIDFINKSNLNDCLQPNGKVYEKLNDVEGLMDVIKEVIKSVMTTSYFIPTNYKTKLFPLSTFESESGSSAEIVVYEYYKTDSTNRRKKGTAYWLRDPMGAGITAAYTKDNGGLAIDFVYSAAYAVAPAFCI